MRLRVAPPSLQCSQQVLPRSSASSPKPTSQFASSSYSTKCTKRKGNICCRFVVSGTTSSTKLLKSRSLDRPISRGGTMKRACSIDEFFHEDLSEIHELAREFELSEDEEDHGESMNTTGTCTMSFVGGEHRSNTPFKSSLLPSKLESLEPFMLGIKPEPPEWPEREEIKWASIERRASSVDLPLSLRMIKKKHQHQEGFGGLRDSTCCSVKKAFSSMVFIILELQSYALKMRETIAYEDLEGIIAGVHNELRASFAWLFQQVFSQTPSLMIHMMILLADFSVYSMSHDAAIQESSLLGTLNAATEKISARGHRNQQLFDSSAMKSFNCKKIGGGKVYPVASGSEGSHSIQYPDSVQSDISRIEDDGKFGEKEVEFWSLVVDEANRLQLESGDEVVDHEMMQLFVSPVSVELEPDDYMEYYRTDLLYQMHLSQDPNNSLLLCNYAQFLHLVARDYDRAEKCFKQAIQVEPFDAEALSQYANFLWIVRKDMAGAEERYIQAVAAEPGNHFHVSKYANFLWSTGGEETCFPLDLS